MSRKADILDIQGQEQQLEESERRAKLSEKQEMDDWKWLMSDKRGRRIAFRLIDMAGVHRPSIDQNTAAMAFKEGKRWFGTLIMEKLERHCFDRYLDMLKESK
ncbi:MAG: hypothetical protein PHW66_06410 [Gallionella sp.]|nr:hypothetical protein [Gallionella sp.]